MGKSQDGDKTPKKTIKSESSGSSAVTPSPKPKAASAKPKAQIVHSCMTQDSYEAMLSPVDGGSTWRRDGGVHGSSPPGKGPQLGGRLPPIFLFEDGPIYVEENDHADDDWWVHYHRRTSSLARGMVAPLLFQSFFWSSYLGPDRASRSWSQAQEPRHRYDGETREGAKR